jgi:hypothetical protein
MSFLDNFFYNPNEIKTVIQTQETTQSIQEEFGTQQPEQAQEYMTYDEYLDRPRYCEVDVKTMQRRQVGYNN